MTRQPGTRDISPRAERPVPVSDPYTLQPWMVLAAQWQQAMQVWLAWWTRGFPTTRRLAGQRFPAATRAPFDPQALSALHESFKPRFAQLWTAATQALARPGELMPQLVQEAPGDRRFSTGVWRDQPYFAWVKQAYLLYGEYLMAVTALAQLPPARSHR